MALGKSRCGDFDDPFPCAVLHVSTSELGGVGVSLCSIVLRANTLHARPQSGGRNSAKKKLFLTLHTPRSSTHNPRPLSHSSSSFCYYCAPACLPHQTLPVDTLLWIPTISSTINTRADDSSHHLSKHHRQLMSASGKGVQASTYLLNEAPTDA